MELPPAEGAQAVNDDMEAEAILELMVDSFTSDPRPSLNAPASAQTEVVFAGAGVADSALASPSGPVGGSERAQVLAVRVFCRVRPSPSSLEEGGLAVDSTATVRRWRGRTHCGAADLLSTTTLWRPARRR